MRYIPILFITICFYSTTIAQVPSYIPLDGLEAWYPFNGNANDESGNEAHGTPQGNYSMSSDRFGSQESAIFLEGVNATFSSAGGHVLLPHFNWSQWESFTISMWVYEDIIHSDGEHYFNIGTSFPHSLNIQRSNAGGGNISFRLTDEASEYHVSTSGTYPGNSFIGEWMNYTLVYDSNTGLSAYLNGELLGTAVPYPGTINWDTQYSAIARHWWNNGANTSTRFTGKIDDVIIYSRALSPLEIASLNNPEAQTLCGNMPQGIAPNTGGWEYNDFIVPEGYRVDSVYANFNRPGYSAATQDFSWSFCPECDTFNNTDNIGAFAYQSVDTSLYDSWIDLSSYEEFVGPGIGRAVAPTNAGVEWVDFCYALSPVDIIEDPCFPSYVPTNGLLAWYPFCDNADDFSGNGLHGLVYGASLTVNRFGEPFSAYSFDGVDDYIEVTNNQGLDFEANDFSISLWVNKKQPSDLTGNGCNCAGVNQWFTGADQGLNEWGLFIGNDVSDQVSFQIETDSGFFAAVSEESIKLGSWHHLVGVRSGSELNLYMNSSLVGSTEIGSSAVLNINRNLLIGVLGNAIEGNANNNLFSFADLDDIAIYNRALTEEEIGNLFTPQICNSCMDNYAAGDLNCNGVVAADDLLEFLINFGGTIE